MRNLQRAPALNVSFTPVKESMSTKIKSIGFIAIYITPCAIIYFLSKYGVFDLHKIFNSLAEGIPALTNYAFCGQAPEAIKSLHLFNIFYSVLVPAIFFRKAIAKNVEMGIKPVLVAIPLVLISLLLMLMGFQLPSADGAGAYIAEYYCSSEIASFILLSAFSAGASAFYLMFFMFSYLFIKTKANKV
jgi:hypothetical protein